MQVWNGNLKDTTNFVTDKYLQINSCGFQSKLSDHTIIRKNGRCDYHILLINSGICEAFYQDKLYTLKPGNLIIYAPGEEQKYTFKSDGASLWCHFTGKIVNELLESCNITSGVYFLNPNKAIYDSYSNLIQRFHQPGREKFANASFIELIYNISDAVSCSNKKENSELILPVLTYLNANYNKHITLDELAKKSGYSKSRFSHIFSQVTGTTPIKYQNDIRLNLSCELLLSTELTITEISFSCGFNDPMYYSRIFKKKYNLSPTEYRLTVSKNQ